MAKIPTKTVVFITGAFLGNNCWDEWKLYFESKGYKCVAPAWPRKDALPEELRNRHPDDLVASNRLSDLVDYFAIIAKTLEEKPILIGHSLGGLIVQLLLQRGTGAVGVAVHSFPPHGVNRFWLPFLQAVWETMELFSSSKQTYLMTFNRWRYSIANGLDYQQQKELYYQYVIPESKKIIREAFCGAAKIDFNRPHVPLLLTSGGNDKLIPASLNYSNYKKYAIGSSITDYVEFKAHTHLVFGVPGWREETECILHWLQGLE